ncbi:DUF1990 domain-containing protein [Kitasatospora sp. NPDC048540]|uniref:DUF1990 family protein n=1 Tax=unclassified Kitasatospora TaxID=2633591 RepID=UPI00053A661B|nr:DUF1990 domain-containing protein [Kitasatospora sp. MBT63]
MNRFSYPEVGATASDGPLPAGYHHLRHRARIGAGREEFAAAGEAIMTWRMHRAVGVGVSASAPRAAPGVLVTVVLGRGRLALTAPCAVVRAVEGPTRIGFAYGTLPGHPERGEECFEVELDPDGQVWFTVTAFSRPARWFTRAVSPLVPVFQRLYVRRCARVLRRPAARGRPGPGPGTG